MYLSPKRNSGHVIKDKVSLVSKPIHPKAAAGGTNRDYGRRPVMQDDLRLSPNARALLNAFDKNKRVLPYNSAAVIPSDESDGASVAPSRSPQPLFDDLLIDKCGERQGFPFAVATEQVGLKDYYETQTYPKRECVWQKVCSLPGAPPGNCGAPSAGGTVWRCSSACSLQAKAA